MKKYFNTKLLLTVFISQCIYFKVTGQNTFPATGNVGIGTLSPSSILQVAGGDANINGIRVGRGNYVVLGNNIDSSNTCFGRNALGKILPSEFSCNSTAIGNSALKNNTTGIQNTAVGSNTLVSNISGSFNVAVGSYNLLYHRSGDNNIAIGKDALFGDTAGHDNIAIGRYALTSSGGTAGNNNIAVGTSTLSGSKGSANIAMGYQSLQGNLTGDQNTAIGNNSMNNNNSGNYNSAVGGSSLFNNTSGIGNAGIGHNSLTNNTSGDYNSAIGFFAGPSSGGLNNTASVGYNARTTASNQVRIGNSSVTSIGGYTNWTNVSDGRIKTNIRENVPGLSFINQLTPVTYTLNLDEADKIIGSDNNKELQMSDDIKNEENIARQKKQQFVYTGFIAQDVEKAAKKLDYDFSGVDAPGNDKSLYGLRYAEFVVPLVKSVQELSKMNDEKDAKINELQKQIDELKEMISGKKGGTKQTIALPAARLEQNAPNPFSNSTAISYSLPDNPVKAKIIITDKSGKTCKEINISGKGKGSIDITTSSFAAGTYQYSLFINDNIIDTKQMLLAK